MPDMCGERHAKAFLGLPRARPLRRNIRAVYNIHTYIPRFLFCGKWKRRPTSPSKPAAAVAAAALCSSVAVDASVFCSSEAAASSAPPGLNLALAGPERS